MSATTAPTWLHVFDEEVRMTPARRRAMVTIGLGEFVDGYDLIVISGAILQLKPHFHLHAGEVAWLSAAAFFGSALGALFFGDLTDRIGRRRVFVLNLAAFVGLALLSAAVTEVWMLYAIRVLIGVAIGADIVASIAFLAEISPSATRGGWTGAMPQITWSLGAMSAILLDAALYTWVGSDAWRLMFAAGALPAVVVLLLRRSLPDSPRWLLARGRVADAIASLGQFGVTVVPVSGQRNSESSGAVAPAATAPSYRAILRMCARGAGLFAILIIGLMPLNGIGQSVLTPYVLKDVTHLSAIGALLGGAVLWLGAILGSWLAWKSLDRIGHITGVVVALFGFVVVYALMITVSGTVALVPLYCLLGVATWFGASAAWPLPSELLPTSVRGRAQGLGSGLQRVSIGVNVLLVPHLIVWLGFRGAVLLVTGVSVVLIPLALSGRRYEPARRSIEHASDDRAGPDLVTATR